MVHLGQYNTLPLMHYYHFTVDSSSRSRRSTEWQSLFANVSSVCIP